jgi:ketosteroid isomerase-like protein
MKLIGLIALLLLGTSLSAMSQNSDTAKELIAAEQNFSDALLRADWKAIQQMYADDMVFTNADGSVTHKSDDVGSIRSGDMKFESIEMSDMKIQDFGDVGIVTGKLVEKGRFKTADLSGTYRFTDVWTKRSGRWLLVAGQETRYTPAK